MSTTLQFLPSLSANLGILQLNNPASLNALTLEMIRSMTPTLRKWQRTGVRATLMVGTPYEKNGKVKPAFCAGGDVKKVYLAGIGKEDKSITTDFFREEYQLNYMIATQAPHLPQVSIWDGVVMGGGVGLSVHGKYRVATERTIFAMPECKIGLFPDVGGTWWIPRLKLYNQWKSGLVGGVGNYLALTGGRLAAEDLLYAGIATHYVKSENLDDLKSALAESTTNSSADDSSGDCVAGVLMSFHDHNVDTKSSFLSQNRNDIDFAFDGKDSMEEIIAALESMGEDSQFGQSTLNTLKQMSPTSLKVTLEGLKRGAKLSSVGEALQMEYRMSQAFMREGSDFYEGIRAALVDKDGKPQWSPQTLEEVTEDIVDSYFKPLGDNELDVNAIGNAKL
jgi:enoyl-CoA hydratase/carnithine racemase